MNYKYGVYPTSQFNNYKDRLHSLVHWLLIYAEEERDPSFLNDYFSKVQYKLDGLNELINYPSELVEIMNLVESAKIEYNKNHYKSELYRKTILDIHDLIKRIPTGN